MVDSGRESVLGSLLCARNERRASECITLTYTASFYRALQNSCKSLYVRCDHMLAAVARASSRGYPMKTNLLTFFLLAFLSALPLLAQAPVGTCTVTNIRGVPVAGTFCGGNAVVSDPQRAQLAELRNRQRHSRASS